MAYSTPRTWTTSELVTAAMLNQDVRDNVAFLANPPACRVYRTASSTVTNNLWEALPVFDAERYDTDTMHSTVTNSGRITINTTGLYVVGGGVEYVANATGLRGLKVRVSNTTDIVVDHENSNGATFGTAVTVSTTYKLTAGQYIELFCYQNSGTGLVVTASAAATPEFWATWVGLG